MADAVGHQPGRRDTLVGRASTGSSAALAWVLVLAVTLPLVVVAGVALGSVSIDPALVASVLGHRLLGVPGEATWSPAQESIVWGVRLPRVLLAVVAGAGLAVCGAALQAMVRNVLADPYLLGISSGASTGAAAAILFGAGGALGAYALPITAFAGAGVAALVVYALARSSGVVTSIRLVMAGVAVGYALSAATSILVFSSDTPEGARSVMFWLLGSLALARWDSALVVVAVVVVGTVLLLVLWGRRLDALAIGDETARTLGVVPDRFRVQLLLLVSLCIGAVVAACGAVGFVGLVLPHVARRLVGASHRRMLPVAALLGATFLVLADIIARTVWSPRELPIGIITALVGAPFLLLLVRRLHAGAP